MLPDEACFLLFPSHAVHHCLLPITNLQLNYEVSSKYQRARLHWGKVHYITVWNFLSQPILFQAVQSKAVESSCGLGGEDSMRLMTAEVFQNSSALGHTPHIRSLCQDYSPFWVSKSSQLQQLFLPFLILWIEISHPQTRGTKIQHQDLQAK